MSDNSSIRTPNSRLPAGWRWVKLGEVCSVHPGQHILESDYNRHGLGVGYLTGPDDFRKISAEVTKWTEKPKAWSEAGDILLTVKGAGVGKPNLAPDERAAIGRQLMAIRPKFELVDQRFLYGVLITRLSELQSEATGSTVPGLARENIELIKIPLPPLQEQKRISAKIQELMQEVERARTACEKQLEAAKSLSAAYVREVYERVEAKKWEKKKLCEIAEKFVNGGTPNTSNPHYWNGNIPWITGADVISLWVSGGRKFITDQGLKNSATHLVNKNTVLIVTRTGVGKVGIAAKDLCFSQDITGVICGTRILPEFLARFLLFVAETLTRIQRGATIQGLTRDDIKFLEIPSPPLLVQQRIVSFLNEKMRQIENLHSPIRNQQSALDSLPQAILKKSFTGDL